MELINQLASFIVALGIPTWRALAKVTALIDWSNQAHIKIRVKIFCPYFFYAFTYLCGNSSWSFLKNQFLFYLFKFVYRKRHIQPLMHSK